MLRLLFALTLLSLSTTAHSVDAFLTDDISVPFNFLKPRTPPGDTPRLKITDTDYAFLKFNLTDVLPADITSARIEKATLAVWVSALKPSTSDITVFRVLEPWSEDRGSASSGPVPTNSAHPTLEETNSRGQATRRHQFVVIDVTEIVKQWIDGQPNYGIALVGTLFVPGGPNRTPFDGFIDSKENTATSHLPRLQVILSSGN
jgi:hypothetical protein